MSHRPKLYIIVYSTFLHVYKLAKSIEEGANTSNLCDVKMFQIKETLPEEVLEKMRAPPKPDLPIITPELLKEADGILFGFPTRYGTLPAQLKEFIDSCGQLWATGALAGKMCGAFSSTATQHGGQETSIFTLLTTLAHFGYASPHLNESMEVMGGSPWGATVIAGKDGTRQPSTKELEIGRTQGELFAKVLFKYHGEPTSEEVVSLEKVKEPLPTQLDEETQHIKSHDKNRIEPNGTDKGATEQAPNLDSVEVPNTALNLATDHHVPEVDPERKIQLDTTTDQPKPITTDTNGNAAPTDGNANGATTELVTEARATDVNNPNTNPEEVKELPSSDGKVKEGHTLGSVTSKDSVGNKSTRSLKSFFKRLSVRSKDK